MPHTKASSRFAGFPRFQQSRFVDNFSTRAQFWNSGIMTRAQLTPAPFKLIAADGFGLLLLPAQHCLTQGCWPSEPVQKDCMVDHFDDCTDCLCTAFSEE
eukprot:3694871-Amphidinium_carterae.1